MLKFGFKYQKEILYLLETNKSMPTFSVLHKDILRVYLLKKIEQTLFEQTHSMVTLGKDIE